MALHSHHKHSLFIVVVGIIAAVLLFRFVGTENLLNVFRTANKRIIVEAILLQVPVFLLWNIKWKIVFNFLKEKSNFWQLLVVLLIGNFGDVVGPGSRMGGVPLRVYYLEKLGYKSDTSLTTVLIERVYNLVAFLILAVFSFAYAFIKLALPIWLIIMMLAAFSVVLGLTYLLLHAFYNEKKGITLAMRIVSKLLPFFYKLKHSKYHREYKTYDKLYNHVYGIIKHFFDEVIVVSKGKVLWAEGVVLSLLYWFVFYLQAWLLFMAVGAPVPFYFVVVMITLSDLVGYLLFIPGGAGVIEVLMILFATSIGIPVASAAAAILLIRGTYYIFGLASGYISMLYFAEEDRHTYLKR